MLTRYLFYSYWLRKNLHTNLLELREIQFKRLKALVKHAYTSVPFYHRKFNEAGFKPEDLESTDDLSRIPLTTKAEIQTNSLEDLIATNVDLSRCVKSATSGSTGLPLTVFMNKPTQDFSEALWARAYMANGLRITDKMAYIWNPLIFHRQKGVLGLPRRKHISVFEDVGTQLKILEQYRPDVIKGFPTWLASLADVGGDSGDYIRPRFVFTGAELLCPRDRLKIGSAFGCEVFDYFGCGEFSLLMWECSEHLGYHMNIDSVAIEFLDEGMAVDPGEEGEIVCSSLQNYVMPLVRYKLGDVGVPIEETCACGRTLPLMKVLRGRSDDLLITPDGRSFFASSLFYNLFSQMCGIKQFRVVQEKRDKLLIQLVIEGSLSRIDSLFAAVRKDIHAALGDYMDMDFQLLKEIERDPTGKLRVFISHI